MNEKAKQYIARAKEIHKDKYDYSLVSDIFSKDDRIDIICQEHGVFNQCISNHVNTKQGCPACAGRKMRTNEEMLKLFDEVHEIKYQYPDFQYKNNRQKLKIVCEKHGEFTQVIKEHQKGANCPRCVGNQKMTTVEFNEKANNVHKNRYIYDKVEYSGNDKKVTITCQKHGDFEQSPHFHLTGGGCPKCHSNSSKIENEWLDSLGLPCLEKQKRFILNGKRYIFDGYDRWTDTVYEFHGDFFHGNPKYYYGRDKNGVSGKRFGDLFKATKERKKFLEGEGFKVVEMWESDWLEMNGKKFNKEPMPPDKSLALKHAFVKSWYIADDEFFDHTNYENLYLNIY